MLIPLTSLVPLTAPRPKLATGRPNLSGANWSDPETARAYAREWYRRNVRPLKVKQRKLRV